MPLFSPSRHQKSEPHSSPRNSADPEKVPDLNYLTKSYRHPTQDEAGKDPQSAPGGGRLTPACQHRRAQGASPEFLDAQADKHARNKTDTQASWQARRHADRSKDRHTHTCRHTRLHTKLKSSTGSYPIRIVAHVSVMEAVVCQVLITYVALQPANDNIY